MIALSFSGAGGHTHGPAGYAAGKVLSNNCGVSPVNGGELVLQGGDASGQRGPPHQARNFAPPEPPRSSPSHRRLRTSKSLVVTSPAHGIVPMNSPRRYTAQSEESFFEGSDCSR